MSCYGQTLLGALSGLGALSLSTDRSVYAVGERPTYLISGAVPGGQIAWSSMFNEQETGEFNVIYPAHPRVAADGTATIEGSAWTAEQAGRWEKEIVIINPDGTMNRASVFFLVSATPQTAAPPASSGILDSSVNLFGYQVPTVGLIGGGLLLFIVLSKRR